MEALGAVVVAVVGTAGTLLAAWLGARRLGRVGLGDAQIQVNASLRELAQTWEQKAAIWQERYDAEVLARTADRQLAVSDKSKVIEELRLTQRDLDQCERQKSDLYSELRQTGRLVDRRAEPRDDQRPIRRRPRAGQPE